jgi:hypothetical protein
MTTIGFCLRRDTRYVAMIAAPAGTPALSLVTVAIEWVSTGLNQTDGDHDDELDQAQFEHPGHPHQQSGTDNAPFEPAPPGALEGLL